MKPRPEPVSWLGQPRAVFLENIDDIVGCDLGDGACVEGFIRDFGRRAYRRPLASDEYERMTALFERGRDGRENDGDSYSFLDGVGNDSHHNMSHRTDDGSRNQMTRIYRFYSELFAYLVDRLANVIEPDGTRLLDNTLVLWGSEICHGRSHSFDNIPFVVAGSAGGQIRNGVSLQYDDVNHCRLLTTAAQAMGLEVDSFGNLDTGSGTLTGLVT